MPFKGWLLEIVCKLDENKIPRMLYHCFGHRHLNKNLFNLNPTISFCGLSNHHSKMTIKDRFSTALKLKCDIEGVILFRSFQ